jgi:hypothetical protein
MMLIGWRLLSRADTSRDAPSESGKYVQRLGALSMANFLHAAASAADAAEWLVPTIAVVKSETQQGWHIRVEEGRHVASKRLVYLAN